MLTKTLIGLAAVTAVVAVSMAPALAGGGKSRTVRAPVYGAAPGYLPRPAYGIRGDGRIHSPNPHQDVYLDYKYSGSDPDPFIRSQLARDPPWNSSRC